MTAAPQRTCIGCRKVRPKAALLRLVRGTDGTSRPLFPVEPNSLKQSTNPSPPGCGSLSKDESGMSAS